MCMRGEDQGLFFFKSLWQQGKEWEGAGQGRMKRIDRLIGRGGYH